MTETQFYIQCLDQFASNGTELLNVLDDIQQGEIRYFNHTADRQISVDLMSDTLLNQLTQHVENDEIENADALYSEFIVDGQDPEDGHYEWTFIPDLNDD